MKVYHYNDHPKFKFRVSDWPARPAGMYFYTKRATVEDFRHKAEYLHIVTLDELRVLKTQKCKWYGGLINKFELSPRSITKAIEREGWEAALLGNRNNELCLFHKDNILEVRTVENS